MSDNKNLLSLEYIRQRDNKNAVMLRVIKSHLFTEYIMNRIIAEKCPDHNKILDDYRSYTYAVKLTLLHCMGIIPNKLNHNLKELNRLRNAFAHNLELDKNITINFYENIDSNVMHKSAKFEPNFENSVEWLYDSAFIDLANLAYNLKIKTHYESK